MVQSPSALSHLERPPCWWRELEILGLIVLVVAAYFLRAADTPLRGEETRWALVAQEMAASGDWVVPRQQGEMFLNRPPLHCWLIAATGLVRGQWDLLTFRLPSLLATLFGTLLIYGYARVSLARLGAFTAAAAFATMAELLQTCRLAETDAIFIPLVSASLFAWHWGYQRGWPKWRMWVLGYSLMALAALTKGPQAPAYFCGGIGVYLIVAGQWRRLFSLGHVLGILAALAIVSGWVGAVIVRLGWHEAQFIWTDQTAIRMQRWTWAEVVRHLFQFPVEVLGCTMPWSLLLIAFLSRSFRATLQSAGPTALFLGVCLAVSFPTCWIPPGGRSRYFAPMYPCLAVLIGLVVQRVADGGLPQRMRNSFKHYLSLMALLMALSAAALLVALVLPRRPSVLAWAEPLPALLYAGVALACAGLAWRVRKDSAVHQVRWGVVAIAGFMATVLSNAVNDFHMRTGPDTAIDVAQAAQKLPADIELVSFRQVHHRFAYFYGKPIAGRPWPAPGQDVGDAETYFCFDAIAPCARETIPFAWEEVAVISMERKRRVDPKEVVVVGRRVRAVAEGGALTSDRRDP